ncbi:PAS domain S-box-containing protein [Aquimarina sp. MAR_2010_214]|uniref:PAS domain-containing hybrid sensor histidine kinase/response regulator n=1 Tax=Aquimarina sp. MAR_2010_214 TaxID=1250026 RepID=UPI000C7159F3|nr:ATP-binding protein [Aquimarina sp. MAR_2010_214]PKV52181.1 PAS domain S-box-containing protein [Aquimarina sp. MAR_2010_214]
MISKWFKRITTTKKTNPKKSQEEQDIIDLIDFLWKEIDISKNTSNLKIKVKAFREFSHVKKIEFLPEIYLLLEEYITEKNEIRRPSKQFVRNQIIEQYNSVFKHTSFKLIFDPLKEQELILCKVFLSKVLEKSSELIGSYNDLKIIQIKKYLNTPYDFRTIDLIKERKNLLEFSNQIFLKIKNSLGINAITNIYLLIYKKHFQSYHLLDSFTATLNVIPEEILAKDLINFPSKQQMHKMLQKQLYSLEEINERLTEEVIERKKVEEELKYSEHLNTTILETAMDGVILVNSKGVVLNWNKQAENILELKREETIGHNIYSLVPYKLRQELKRSFSNYIQTGNDELINKRVETSVNRKNGSIVYIELTVIAIETKDDYLFNGFFRDITNRKIIDNEIREAKVIAEKSTKAKTVFLSNMSHEIRTPLNVILGLTGILQKSNFTNPQVDKKNLDGIQFSAENLLILINDILDFSKIEAGKLTLHNTDFSLKELITNISRGFKIKADEKGLKYTTLITPSVPKFIIGDQLRLNQILINLIGNAIKFTQTGEITIQVKTEESSTEGIIINFSVKDTGVGIPENKLKNIFESFYQVHKPGKDKIEGTGLGLSISKQLIELQGGILKAESKPGAGSTFDFSITYGKSNFRSTGINKKHTTMSDNTPNLSGMRVLVVEDNKMNQFFIKQLFSNWHIDTHIADNGVIALEKLKSSTYDLILMDMHMPIMDGPETTEIIRNSNNNQINKIPIIACSADVFPESKKKAIESGMNFYLTKPLSEQALEEVLLSIQSKNSQNDISIPNNIDHPNKLTSLETKKLCDLSFLKNTFDNDTEIIKGVLQMFIDETPKDYQKLRQAIEEKNWGVTQETAHKLKSSFKTIGLKNETDILQKIEYSSKEKLDFNLLKEHFMVLNQSYSKIIKEINNYIQDFPS